MTDYAILLPGDEDAWAALSKDEQAAVFASTRVLKALEAVATRSPAAPSSRTRATPG